MVRSRRKRKAQDKNKRFQRRDDIDWLRGLCILLLFPFNAAVIFDFWGTFFVKNTETSQVLSYFIALVQYWFMPLLFWLSGAASWYSLGVRNSSEYMRERFIRLLVPFVFGVCIIVPPMGYLSCIGEQGYFQGYIQFLTGFFTNFSNLSGYNGTFTPAHLWFIFYLFIFSIITLPLFMCIRKSNEILVLKIESFADIHWVLIFMFIPLGLMSLLPGPSGKNPFYFIFIYILGYIIASNDKLQNCIDKIRFKAFIFLIIYVPVCLWFILGNEYFSTLRIFSIVEVFMVSLATWLTLIVIIGYAHKYLNFKHPFLSYINEAGLPLYIIHQTILVYIGFYIVRLPMGVYTKFIIITILTLLISAAFYKYIINKVPIIRFLFGLKAIKRVNKGR
ncbi:MAG: acyltransferase family protein [Bacillota bacterium]|nr:acyltransferase family protein [Bacillota bacterium]